MVRKRKTKAEGMNGWEGGESFIFLRTEGKGNPVRKNKGKKKGY